MTLRSLNAPQWMWNDSSESRMSLGDSLDHVYLGPDEELDSDSGSSRGLDVLDAIPDPSFPAQADDLALFNDPDLYLGPEDDLIECDDAPAVPDSPMTRAQPLPTSIDSAGSHNEELHAMIQEFMPIGSYDQTE
ncbi:hypothetical protein F4604DRAFT_1695788, partial [Suillus subluteus]